MSCATQQRKQYLLIKLYYKIIFYFACEGTIYTIISKFSIYFVPFYTAVFADVVENFKKFEETGRQLQESQSERIIELESKFLEICEKYA